MIRILKVEAVLRRRMVGVITDIQRFSIHDGFGIRTTVFLKGCNMDCIWCHNPETINAKPQLTFMHDSCIACGNCIKECTKGAIFYSETGNKVYTDLQKCMKCFSCVDVCYTKARVLNGKSITSEALLEEILMDKEYYKNGGGVTFSGGEPILQDKFLLEMIELCHQNSIRCAIETNLSLQWGRLEPILQKLDLIMFDLKAFDDKLHKELTGISNQLILSNAQKVDKIGKPFIVRTPVIPGINSDEVIRIADCLKSFHNLLYYELLPYNPFAEEKFKRIDKEYQLVGAKAPTQKYMRDLINYLKSLGINAKQMGGK